MSLLTIARGLAQDVGLAVPDQVVGSPKREMIELRSFADATGEELARRADWGQLQASTTLTGDGTQLAHALPAGFSRIAGPFVTTYGIASPHAGRMGTTAGCGNRAISCCATIPCASGRIWRMARR